jgi:molybdopterin/thiamine biosynthesis adenylyltransferase
MMPDTTYSVAMTDALDALLTQHLLRQDRQEDLCFALWSPSNGRQRTTALLNEVVLPLPGERSVHGNASFEAAYFERAATLAARAEKGLAFLHSHIGPGWQGMSHDDVVAERDRLAGASAALTGLPLVGLTLGTDGSWSARFWPRIGPRQYKRQWCEAVRVVGDGLRVSYCDDLCPRQGFRELFSRTVTVWGAEKHGDLARLRIGIVGLGSVGSIVAETLARMGMQHLTLIDFDRVKEHNLDRLMFASGADVGRPKVEVAAERLKNVATAERLAVRCVEHSIVEADGYAEGLDCDVIFSCVDRPRARHVLNHFAYAHLIPVIDGGIAVRMRRGVFAGVDWQVQTVAPGRPCLECLGAYDPNDVSVEAGGMLDDPSYLKGLPADHRYKRNENVFPFSCNLASLEVMQFVALATGIARMPRIGVQRYRYIPGIVELLEDIACKASCDVSTLVAAGDRHFALTGRDITAELVRAEAEGWRPQCQQA